MLVKAAVYNTAYIAAYYNQMYNSILGWLEIYLLNSLSVPNTN